MSRQCPNRLACRPIVREHRIQRLANPRRRAISSEATIKLSESQRAILERVLDAAVSTGDGVIVRGRPVPCNQGVLQFREDSGYNYSFELQWKQFQLNQYDAKNATTLYRDRYVRMTGWPTEGLEGEVILEAGCGAGAFTCHLVATGADLVSIDYSGAVEVSAEHNKSPRAVFVQADIMDLPFRAGSFDRVFCHGVLQHTPDPASAFRALDRCLRPGGLISIDVYAKDGRIETYKAKYLWRPLTTKISPERLMDFLRIFIPIWLPVDTLIKRIPYFGRYFGAIIPCMNYSYTNLSQEQKREWAIMNTFDALAPTYDKPASVDEVRQWFDRAHYRDVVVRNLDGIVHGTGTKPEK